MDVQVKFDKETVWLSLNQISDLFDKDKSVISRHLNNIFKEGELERKATVAKNATVQIEGEREVVRNIEFFNLDVIISVGYRVNSKKGTQFRIWATNQLKKYLVKGYSINEKRLKQLQQTIQLVKRASKQISNTDEAQGLMEVLSDYSRALDILDDYDHQKLSKISL
ncbi:MAG: virulence RhuM family protein [Flavobacteriaceae bacterium]|nr:virulence RhuM family protein [Flavobacteriaceae bacterium]